MTIAEFLRKIDACSSAVAWSEGRDDPIAAWKGCQNGEWLVWIVGKYSEDRHELVRCTHDCVEIALRYTKDARVERCLMIARSWAAGDHTVEEVLAARAAAFYAYWDGRETDAVAMYAAYATCKVADIAYAADVHKAASAAIHTCIMAAGDNADEMRRWCTDIVLSYYPEPPKEILVCL
jgi:hypothetical protein